MRGLPAVAAVLVSVCAMPRAEAESPVLAIRLRGALPRPLVFFISDWTGRAPRLEAFVDSQPLPAELSEISSSGAQWDATVRSSAGEAHIQLAIRGTTALGDFDGVFNGAQLHGAVEASVVWKQPGALLWIPEPAKPVRAVLLWDEGRLHDVLDEAPQAFCAANNVAVVGLDAGFNSSESGDADDRLSALAAVSGHREIATAPILLRGAPFIGPAMRRVIAWADSKGGGERDLPSREWPFTLPGNHESLPLLLIHFQHTLDVRLPGAKPLPVVPGGAWLADDSTWKSEIAKILPAAASKGVPAHMSWLPDKDVAWIYRGAVALDSPLKLTLARGHGIGYFPGEPVVLDCEGVRGGQWKSVGLYDGAKRIALLTGNQTLTLAAAQKQGVHAGVLLGERADGSLRTSAPVAWIVRPAL
jgi:hypothetical protein